MATSAPGRACGSKPQDRSESRREHEFYRYFEPIRYMTEDGPTYCDVRDAKAREQHKPFSCPDKTLTAFCQLGALRFKARRCLLFFFDVNYAYAMAEATQSLSLEDDNVHDLNDQLWLGHAKIPRNIACCEITANLPSFSPSSSTMNGERDSVFIVEDLTKEPQLSDRPYVSGFPNGRFYAGVPITAPSGINIGAYCILDDEPRNNGVSDKDLMFLRDMSRTVMTHLETVRAQAERERATHMVTGLGAFVKRSSDSRRWERRNPTTPATRNPASSARTERNGFVNRGSYRSVRRTFPPALTGLEFSTTQDTTPTTPLDKSDPARSKVSTQPSRSSKSDHTNLLKAAHASEIDHAGRLPETSATFEPNHKLDQQKPQPKTPDTRPQLRRTESTMNVRSIYQRASEIMCDSLSVDGVAFADASVRTFGGLAETVDSVGATDVSTSDESETGSMTGSIKSIKSRPQTPSLYTKGSVCQLLGCAESLRDEPAEATDGQPATKLTDSFLRQLLRRHPHGKIWSFSAHGQAHSEDTSSSGNEDLQETEARISSLSAGAQQRKRRQAEGRKDAEILASMFPGARSVALHGIRDASRRRWMAGCIVWSYDPLRVLTGDTEMNLMAAFCDIIAGETRRLEIQKSDKAKSDFISSISHELRSPLHGILGSTEVLKDLDLNSMASTLAGQIDSCGRTLLDIIDHLLDFATLKVQRIEKGVASSSKIRHRISLKENKAPADDDLTDVEASVALDDLTEEAVESTVYSFNCKKGADYEPRTSVILDIDRSVSNQWYCGIATGGWRRICINLITNALKYTPAGYIRVSLSQKPRPGSKRHFDAVFTVTDSGKGMSKEFLVNRLFHDFAQEDTLADGIGLGMHMVGRIVHAIGAKIDVVSEQKGAGAGTSVTVTVPLEHSQKRQDSDDAAKSIEASALALPANLQVRIIGNRSAPILDETQENRLMSTAFDLAVASLEKSCGALGLQLQKSDSTQCDLNFVFEADFEYSVRAHENDSGPLDVSKKPYIVICNSNPSGKTVKASRDEAIIRIGSAVEYVAMPCGAKTIARAVSSALIRQEELDATVPREEKTPLGTLKKVDVEESEIPLSIHLDPSAQELLLRSPSGSQQIVQKEASIPMGETSQASQSSTPKPSPYTTTTTITTTTQKKPSQNNLLNPNPSSTLLLVDDNKINLQLLTMYAKKRSYPYLAATDGLMAVRAYQQAHHNSSQIPSVILMDINMPTMDGYEATQQIRAYEKKHDLPGAKIIALTALGSEAAWQEAFGSGCDLFLTKPVKLGDLTRIIEGT